MRRGILYLVPVVVLVMAGATIGYTKIMARIGSGEPPASAPGEKQADHIIVSKSDKTMYLLRDDEILRSYRIAMGANWDQGHKQREGDERTPEGTYRIDWRNPDSVAHLSLHISYPNDDDIEQARRGGFDPGGNIMIHGLPNGWGAVGGLHRFVDWTDGCIAVRNDEMREIWSFTPNGTPITITGEWAGP